mgnify:CR=1 FL=1
MRDSIILLQSPSYQRHQKRKKERPTNHSGEPLYDQNPLILGHSSILLPASTQIPMALFLNSRLCRCYTLMTFTPLYPIYPTQFDIRHSTNGIRQIALLPTKPIFLSAAQSHQSSLKSCTNSCDSSVSDAVCLVSNCEKRLSR